MSAKYFLSVKRMSPFIGLILLLASAAGSGEVAIFARPWSETLQARSAGTKRDTVDSQSTAPAPRPKEEGRHWLRHSVVFSMDRQPLAEVLREFAARQGVTATVSASLGGTVSGTFSFTHPGEFLDLLCRTKHMSWYFDGATVYFFPNAEMETRLFPLQDRSEEVLRHTLRELGFFDPHLEWRPADGGRLLMVQGPAIYLSRIAEVVDRMGEAEKIEREEEADRPREKTLGVFRLKHAWAADKTILTGDINTTVPGVADVLRQILSNTRYPGRGELPVERDSGTPRLIKGHGVIGRGSLAAEPIGETPDNGAPFIQADPRINAVLIWDFEENMDRYRDIISALDHPLELVEIRAAIIDVETDRTRELGFTWEYRGENSNWENNAGVNVGDTRSIIPITGNGLQYATIYRHGLDSFMAKVSLMEQEGDANVLSRPSVLTQDNIQAVLEHTDTFYVRLEGQEEVDLADIKTGLTLKVTPHVIMSEDDSCVEGIQMAVHIVNGTNTADSNDAMVDNLPRVRQSTITTQAVVGEGEALVIGGYYNEIRSTSRTGVPGLSRIPGLGVLFRNKTNIASKSERLFVLSPRIVRMNETPLLPGSEGERLMEESPGRDSLTVPAIDARAFQPKARK